MTLIYIQTQGCSANQDDSSIISNKIIENGYDLTSNEDEIQYSDLLIFNTCTVKNPTEDKFVSLLKKYKNENKKIIVTGCIAQSLKPLIKKNSKLISIRGMEKDEKKLNDIFENISLVGVNQIDNIINAIENEFNNKHVQLLEDKQLIKSNINRDAKVIQTVQILTGCLGAPCTYCKTIFARGKLVSFPLNDIKKRVEFLVNNGTKIIYLTSQDNAVYGMDINSNLPTLLNELLSIPGDFKIRLGMGNPDHYMLYKKELVEIFKNDKMFKFFHIPIQSGSNKILTHMRRGYTIEHFNEIYDEIKLEIPDLVFATDIICGFPYEDENDFNQTLEIVNKCKFDVINISKFYPRLGTLAAEYEQLHNDIKKERSKELSLLHNKIAFENKLKYMDKELNVIVEAKNGNDLICRTDNYTQVIVKDNSEIKIGESFKVKIIETSTWHLIGVLI